MNVAVIVCILAMLGTPRAVPMTLFPEGVSAQLAAPRGMPSTLGHLSEAPHLTGLATWYVVPGRVAAAGAEVRRWLGPGWRGESVTVCRATSEACVRVRLVDWCACPGRRVIDLSPSAFSVLAELNVGVVAVEIRREHAPGTPPPTAPPTDTEE